MSLINLSLKHGRTAAEARTSLEKAVGDLQGLFGTLIQRADWSSDRNRVRLDGAGFWVEMSVDDQHVHATGDIPFLAGLLGGPLGDGLKKILEETVSEETDLMGPRPIDPGPRTMRLPMATKPTRLQQQACDRLADALTADRGGASPRQPWPTWMR